MILLSAVGLGLLSGLHGASYGSYKDSPHESFLARRFVRELMIAALVAIALAASHFAAGESRFVFFVSTFALTRIITEFWKLFIRTEPQEQFRIPTQIHWLKNVVHKRSIRLLAGAGFVASIYGAYCLFKLVPADFPHAATGVVVGGGFGVIEAIAGAYKDGSIEGFSLRKFLKSPTFGAIGGWLASLHTDSLVFLLLTGYGFCRMLLELLFKILRRDYVPGKFRSIIGPFTQWRERRRYFLVPYTATWLLCIAMLLIAVVQPSQGKSLWTGPLGHVGVSILSTAPAVKGHVERHYVLGARVRPLLFWVGRDDVGAGRITWRQEAGGGRGLELLIGSDPDKAPMGINRWGYIAEAAHDDIADVIAVMTQSDGETIQEARKQVGGPADGDHLYRAVRTHIHGGHSATTVIHLLLPKTLTYRAVDLVRERILTSTGSVRVAGLPAGADHGFLFAVARLIQDSVEAHRTSKTLPRGLSRNFLFAGRGYNVTLLSSKPTPRFRLGTTYCDVLESEFQVTNRTTDRRTNFWITYGTEEPIDEVPVRIVYRPNWWFEAELNLHNGGASGS